MNRDPGRTRAFTLIELLIVVAIIAILAAIAVPNFLEAQTRAKVTRCKGDFRSIGVALEAYRLDYNTFPIMEWQSSHYSRGLLRLTTPIAYISAIPRDPFTIQDPAGTPDWSIEYAAGVAGVSAGSYNSPNNIWLLESEGPDKIDNVASPGFPWPRAMYPPSSVVSRFIDLVYDPTNGTRSQGSISRTGGAMPPEPQILEFCLAVNQ